MRLIARLIREPLLHFLAIGGLITITHGFIATELMSQKLMEQLNLVILLRDRPCRKKWIP